MQKARPQAFPLRDIALGLFVGIRFQVLFHSPPGVLFTFPSRYWFTIGRQEYLALDGGPPGFPHERPSTWYSGGRTWRSIAAPTGLSPSMARLSCRVRLPIDFLT